MGFLNRRHARRRKKGPWRENADPEAAERVREAEEEKQPPSPEIVRWRRELRGARKDDEESGLQQERGTAGICDEDLEVPERARRADCGGPADLPGLRCADGTGGQVSPMPRDPIIGKDRDIKAENEYLRQALALRRKLQEFLDGNVRASYPFTLGDGTWYRVTKAQKKILMEMAPEDVRKANER